MLICTPFKGISLKKALSLADQAKDSDLFELRFDDIRNLKDLDLFFEKIQKPILYKTTSFQNFEEILKFKPDYVDLDHFQTKKYFRRIKKTSPNSKIILSYHNFTETPSLQKLKKLAQEMKKQGADIVKIALKANSLSDSLLVLKLTSELRDESITPICLAMGNQGKLTRLTGHLFGNYLTFAPLESVFSTAKGQVPLKQLKEISNLID